MSSGHRHPGGSGGQGKLIIDRILKNPDVQRELYEWWPVDRGYDLPYLGGTSSNERKIYLDRHLPFSLSYEHDGLKKEFNPTEYLCNHEKFERACMDVLGWGYEHAHQAATGYERRSVLAAGLFWQPYQSAVERFVKAAEHESLQKVPPDLDMRPYNSPPPDKALIARMEKAMGGKNAAKHSKAEAEYTDHGHASTHCGPVAQWKTGQCEHFEAPSSCELVRGHISARGWCKYWKGAS